MCTQLKTALCAALLSFMPLASLHAQLPERLSMQQAISIALESNPDVLRAQKLIDAAAGRILQAGRIENPELSFGWSESPTPFNIGGAHERDFGISQAIEFPTKRSRRVAVAATDKRIAELRLEQTRRAVASRVRLRYCESLSASQTTATLREHIGLLTDLQSTILRRYEQGQGVYLDVVRARIELARANNDLASALREVRRATAELNVAMGRAGDVPLEPTDSVRYEHVSVQRDSALRDGLERSASLALARLSVERQQESLALSKTAYLPDFGIGLTGQQHVGVDRHWGMDVRVSVPFWFWHEPRGLVNEATAMIDVSTLRQGQTEQRLRTNIVNALDAVQTADAQVQALNASVMTDIRDLLAAAVLQYGNNQLDVLNLLDVYRTSRAATAEYTRAVVHYMLALVELESAGELPAED